MANYGPPDDFHQQPTQHVPWDQFQPSGHPAPAQPTVAAHPPGQPPGLQGEYGPPEPQGEYQSPEPLDPDAQPAPWYRRPLALALWALLVLVLIALIVYGTGQLIGGGEGTSNTPAPSTTSITTTTPSETTAPSQTTTPSESTTTPETAPTAAPAPPPGGTPPPRQGPPTQQPPQAPTKVPHHPHLPPLPSVITIPGHPPITLPPNLP